MINRIVATLVASLVASTISMPFDTLRMRLYTQRPLPNGKWPYEGSLDCLSKIIKYEANIKNNGNLQCLYPGFLPYFGRFFLIALVSQYLLDFYRSGNFIQELWTPGSYSRVPTIALNVYEPFTLAYHKGTVAKVTEDIEETAGLTPDLKPLKVV
jgi:hypothetical protein